MPDGKTRAFPEDQTQVRHYLCYSVKYSTNGEDSEPIGTVIMPGRYFYWRDEDDYHMFGTPPSTTTVIYHGRYGKNHKLDFKYLHFLDYADNVEGKVRMISLRVCSFNPSL